MAKEIKKDIADTIRVLTQLDERSLLLIDSGARLLAARQDMDKDQIEQEDNNAIFV